MSDFAVEKRLGSGSFGTVYRARRIVDDRVYAIKEVRISELSERQKDDAINEVMLLAKMDSPFVVRYYDSFIERNMLNVVMEYANRGDLAVLVKKAKKKGMASLPEPRIWDIFIQVCLGLHYIHAQRVLHRDIKAANVFIHKDEATGRHVVKIGDLGVAKLLGGSASFASTIVGTPYYLSPELCEDLPYNAKSDVWSLGVVLYECCTLAHPFNANNQCALILKIIQGRYEPVATPGISHRLRDLVARLLVRDAGRRPSVGDILRIPSVHEKALQLRMALPDDLGAPSADEKGPPDARGAPADKHAPRSPAAPARDRREQKLRSVSPSASDRKECASEGSAGGGSTGDAAALCARRDGKGPGSAGLEASDPKELASERPPLTRPLAPSGELGGGRFSERRAGARRRPSADGVRRSGGAAVLAQDGHVRGGRVRGSGPRRMSPGQQQHALQRRARRSRIVTELPRAAERKGAGRRVPTVRDLEAAMGEEKGPGRLGDGARGAAGPPQGPSDTVRDGTAAWAPEDADTEDEAEYRRSRKGDDAASDGWLGVRGAAKAGADAAAPGGGGGGRAAGEAPPGGRRPKGERESFESVQEELEASLAPSQAKLMGTGGAAEEVEEVQEGEEGEVEEGGEEDFWNLERLRDALEERIDEAERLRQRVEEIRKLCRGMLGSGGFQELYALLEGFWRSAGDGEGAEGAMDEVNRRAEEVVSRCEAPALAESGGVCSACEAVFHIQRLLAHEVGLREASEAVLEVEDLLREYDEDAEDYAADGFEGDGPAAP